MRAPARLTGARGRRRALRTDAVTSFGVLAGLALIEITGIVAFDALAAIAVAFAIVITGFRILSRSGEGADRRGAATARVRPH